MLFELRRTVHIFLLSLYVISLITRIVSLYSIELPMFLTNDNFFGLISHLFIQVCTLFHMGHLINVLILITQI